ncbi:MAG: hypothetical protein ONB46_17745 [candidate division KSB1 bacterium]|nr:hypothetical protein [candidate division KSB1 bacterium]MDZ7367645.1 hypothetical protein [candidate division KSB1 bacterium]MDZ7404839.1 hypothetical protein [candidate division KSB1 bacterium]
MALKTWGAAVVNRLARPFRFLQHNRKVKIVFFSSLLVFPLFIFIVAVILPVAKNPFEASVDDEFGKSTETLTDSTSAEIIAGRQELARKMASLEIDQAFFQARLLLSKNDSIGLVVDLIDSVAALEIKGVPIRRCKILRYRSAGLTRRLRNQGRLHQWLSTPFVLQKELATLPKSPIRIKEAPKDTIEANESKGEDLPIEHRDAEFTLQFDRNLNLVVEQAQTPSFSGRWRKIWYALRRSFGTTRDAVVALAHLRLPQHRMWIEIEISREDAKAIYRALPHRAEMALRL